MMLQMERSCWGREGESQTRSRSARAGLGSALKQHGYEVK